MATITSIHGRRLGVEVGTNDLVTLGGIKHEDGSPVAVYLKAPTYAVAGVPSAATAGAGTIIYVSNGAAGSPVLAFSDGTNWLRSDTGAAIAAA